MSQSSFTDLDRDTDRYLETVTDVVSTGERFRSVSLQRLMGLKLFAHGHHDEAELCLRGAFRTAREERDRDQEALIGLDLARIVLFRSPREALGMLKAVQRSDSASLNKACFHNLIGTAFLELCCFDLAERNLARAIEASGRGEDVFHAYAHANRAGTAFLQGDARTAGGLNRRAVERLEAADDRSSVGLVVCNMAIHCMLQGLYDQAYKLLERSRGFQVVSSNVRLSAMVELCAGELELVVGDPETAIDRFSAAERSAGLASQPALRARAMIWRAIVERRTTTRVLLADVEAAARDLHARDMRCDSAMVYMVAACFAEREGEPAARLRNTARSIFDSDEGLQFIEGHYTRILAALADRRDARPAQPFPRFLSQSSAIGAIKTHLQRLANTEVRLLLEGESGAGKTFLARQIHESGKRRSAPFVVVDCTNLEENLFESKLFGHVRGSFTGAVSDSVGLVEEAHTGTLFLDEIGELPLEIQAKLLYTIEECRYRPVGARAEKVSEFRVMAATNRDIDVMLADGTLRADLFYRLAGYRVLLPPLRRRREDIVPLAESFLGVLNRRYNRRKFLRADAWEAIATYDWPGNVRELNTALERGFHLATGRHIGLDDLGLGLSPTSLSAEDLSWYGVRRSHLLRVLRLCRGNVTRTARLLGINRTTLIYKLKLLDIERADFDPSATVQPEPKLLRVVADREEPAGH